MTYPGGKNGAGVFQQIINQIPPIDVFIECFYGSGAVTRHMKRAAVSVAVDLDQECLDEFAPPGVIALNCDAISYLRGLADMGTFEGQRVFVYADPPYLMETRSAGRDLYRYEFGEVAQHEELLGVLLGLPCMVAISGYWSELYAARLGAWRSISFNAQTRGGKTAREWLWMNYEEPAALQDYAWLGNNFREREKIARQKRRWKARLLRMDRLQRYALLSSIADLGGAEENVS